MQLSLPDEGKIKQMMKEALIEALQEQKGIFHDLIVEALEDIALTRAIREGAKSKSASRKEISEILKGQA
jgi:signal transduction histidine kinase